LVERVKLLRAFGKAHSLIIVEPNSTCKTAIDRQVGTGGASREAGLAQIIEKDVGLVSSRAIGDADASVIEQIVICVAAGANYR
jgi:hypothetical protein